VRGPATTELGDKLLCAARVSPRGKILEKKARAVNEAAAHAATLGFTQESMRELIGEWTSGHVMLGVEEEAYHCGS
jgi:hypothetical protein